MVLNLDGLMKIQKVTFILTRIETVMLEDMPPYWMW